jgi:hypothetical protein
MKTEYTFAGRKFRALEVSTLEHDIFFMNQVRAAGLDKFAVPEGEQPEQTTVRILHEVLASGKVFVILGALLIPADIADLDWTPELGAQTADFMRKLIAPDDKQQIQPLIISLVRHFFQSGAVYSTNSRSSLSRTASAAPVHVPPKSEDQSAQSI